MMESVKERLNKVLEFVKCPETGSEHFGNWGILTREQRLFLDRLAKDAIELIDCMDAKIRETEHKIEQGKMIELPCKVGDTVFYVSSYGIEEFVVSAIEFIKTKYDDWGMNSIHFEDKETGERRFNYHCYFAWIGKSVVFTREEAEKRLKELQE